MKTPATILALIFAAGTATSLADKLPDASKYIGTKKCKMCHKKDETGAQFAKWQGGPHAKTFEVLGTVEAKAVAKKLGISFRALRYRLEKLGLD